MKLNRISALFIGLGFVACEVDKPEITPMPTLPGTPPVATPAPFMGKNIVDPGNLDRSVAHHDPIASVSLMPKPEPEEDPYRNRRRMDLDQLDAAIKTVSGGLEWTVNGDNQFEELSSTLGKPDYATITQEDLDTSAMFLKFLNDAARDVCFKLVEQDAARAVSNRILFRYATPEQTMASDPNSIEINLVYLLKRFHGLSAIASCEDCDDESPNALGNELQQWVWLYQAAEHVSGSSSDAWRTVCIALMTHPDFYMY